MYQTDLNIIAQETEEREEENYSFRNWLKMKIGKRYNRVGKILPIVFLLCMSIPLSAQKTIDGVHFSACINKKVRPDFYKNKFLVLDFWATWCGPCIGSFPAVNELEKKYSSNPKVVFASITTESKGKVDTFFSRKKAQMPGVLNLIDDKGATWTNFNINLIPTILVFSPTGKLVFEGRIEKLKGCMDQLLKGAVILEVEKTKVSNEWEDYKKTASFIAVTGPADSSAPQSSSTNTSKEKVTCMLNNYSLQDVVSTMSGVTNTRIKSNNPLKLNAHINLYYKQLKDCFPEFDKGVFTQQYQNHILHLLEQNYGLRSEWVTEKTQAYNIVVKDRALLEKNITISTKGSYGSRIDGEKKKYNYVNGYIEKFASVAEDELGVIIYTDIKNNKGYDVMLEFSSFSAFTKYIETYGLSLEKVENYEVKKLNLVFD
jgi:thiol-disulfide isomerase/thioredoxin